MGGASVSVLDFLFKKTAHIIEYALLVFFLARAFSGPGRLYRAAYLSLAYAFIDEIHQLFTPGRTGTIRDVLIFDFLGILIAFLLLSRPPFKRLLNL